MAGMPGGIGHGDNSAERRAIDDGSDDTQGIAERPDVIGPLIERPELFRTSIAPTVSPVIQIDHLSHLGQRRKRRLVARVVGAGATMQQQQQRWRFGHDIAGGTQSKPLDVEEEVNAVDEDLHVRTSSVESFAGIDHSVAPIVRLQLGKPLGLPIAWLPRHSNRYVDVRAPDRKSLLADSTRSQDEKWLARLASGDTD